MDELSRLLADKPGFVVQHNDTTLLVRCTLGKRAQTVKVTMRTAGNPGAFNMIRLESRTCPARDYRFVLDALKLNAESEWGGLALDESVSPPVIDVVYNLVADGIHPFAFTTALLRVAWFADRIETLTGGTDRF